MKHLSLLFLILFFVSSSHAQVKNWPPSRFLPTPVAGNMVYTTSSAYALLPAGTSGQILTSGGAGAPTWGTGGGSSGITSLNSQTGATQVFANDTNVIITSSAGTHTLGWTGTLSLARGGTGAALTATNGGIHYSTASATAITVAGTSGQFLVSGGAGAPTWASPSTARICVDTGNGVGSTGGNLIRRFTNITDNNGGSAIVYADSATDGASFTIQAGFSGMYGLTYSDSSSSVNGFGWSKNDGPTQLTTDIIALSNTYRLIFTSGANGSTPNVAGSFYLAAGDVVRPHIYANAGLSSAAFIQACVAKTN